MKSPAVKVVKAWIRLCLRASGRPTGFYQDGRLCWFEVHPAEDGGITGPVWQDGPEGIQQIGHIQITEAGKVLKAPAIFRSTHE